MGGQISGSKTNLGGAQTLGQRPAQKRIQTQHAVSIAPGHSSCGMDEKFDVGNWEVVWNRGSVGWGFKDVFLVNYRDGDDTDTVWYDMNISGNPQSWQHD